MIISPSTLVYPAVLKSIISCSYSNIILEEMIEGFVGISGSSGSSMPLSSLPQLMQREQESASRR